MGGDRTAQFSSQEATRNKNCIFTAMKVYKILPLNKNKVSAMKKDHFEVLLEEMKGQFTLVLEGHDAIRHEFNEKLDALGEKVEINSIEIKALSKRIDGVEDNLGKRIDGVEGKVDGLGERIDGVEDRLSKIIDGVEGKVDGLGKKIDSVAADLAAHRADTESHRGYKVCEGQ